MSDKTETEGADAKDLSVLEALAHLDREIAELTTARAVLARLLGVEDEPDDDEEDEEELPTEVKPAKKSRPAGGGSNATRLAIARFLRGAGPQTVKQITDATGLNPKTACAALQHEWFRKQEGNRMSPYELSPEGSAAVAETGATE